MNKGKDDRMFIAAMAMHALLGVESPTANFGPAELAEVAVHIADALLEELENDPTD